MGQKVNPHGLRVGVIKDWDSRWFVNGKLSAIPLLRITNCVISSKKNLYSWYFPPLKLNATAVRTKIHIHCAKPGIVIGRGAEIEKFRADLEKMIGKTVNINIVEVRQPDLNSQLVAENIAPSWNAEFPSAVL